ncbi:hypothetical protein SARC_10998 [Sphaeroforma arctica JP610]|uniref:Ribosomal protein L14 n=1 Tax=Sphaeroforma arctica JP610 TaxID=667725 RepID=A0A0L0FI88_9EUKA|nr:hypothetical protein SARC_10998 [Sphaeroforma arctica JP610]KNC76502.1 hypothetical protein SARC_10998 [Sphaeroforma arctica JP610]|eukprot:XP_014150404.1 hypothetical protein SARC_10998 [Sphaeroforma arctica JP610]
MAELWSISPIALKSSNLVLLFICIDFQKGQKGIDGRQIVFGDNACILVNQKNEPLGTRIVSQTGVIGELISMRTSSKLQSLIPKL